jgi:hypothetical protein
MDKRILSRQLRSISAVDTHGCEHEYADHALVFSGSVRSRACRTCGWVEIMVERTGEWLDIDTYVDMRIANRAAIE